MSRDCDIGIDPLLSFLKFHLSAIKDMFNTCFSVKTSKVKKVLMIMGISANPISSHIHAYT